jgi:hypothetical protein
MSLPHLNFVVPGDQDILCGRSHLFFNHPGNVRFREIIARHMSEYSRAETKSAKTSVVRDVVRKIWYEGGKFLKLDKASNKWFESDALCATSKVGHAFRDAIAEQQVHFPRETGELDQEPRIDSGSDANSPDELASSLLLLGKAATNVAARRSGYVDQGRSNPPKARSAATCSTIELTKSPSVSKLQEPKTSSELEDSQKTGIVVTTKQAELKKRTLSQDTISQRERDLSKTSHSRKDFHHCSSSSVGLSADSTERSMKAIESQVEIIQSSATFRDWPAVAPPSLPFAAPNLGPSNQKSLLSRHALQSLSQLSRRDPKGDPSSSRRHSVTTMPSVITAEDQKSHQCMVPSLHERLPSMMYTHELKKVMYQTLALRQKALEQNTAIYGCIKNESALANVDELIEKAKASARSPSEILKQALAAQTTSLIIDSGNAVISTEPRNALTWNPIDIDANALPHSAEHRKYGNDASHDNKVGSTAERALPTTDKQELGEKDSNDSNVNVVGGRASMSETAIVSPDDLNKPFLPPTMLLDLQGTKRRRSPDSDTIELPKKRMPLAQVAADYTIQSQNCLGSFCTFSSVIDESTKSMYFL